MPRPRCKIRAPPELQPLSLFPPCPLRSNYQCSDRPSTNVSITQLITLKPLSLFPHRGVNQGLCVSSKSLYPWKTQSHSCGTSTFYPHGSPVLERLYSISRDAFFNKIQPPTTTIKEINSLNLQVETFREALAEAHGNRTHRPQLSLQSGWF